MANVTEINGTWYLVREDGSTGTNLYASSREDAEERAAAIRPMPTSPLPAGSLRDYTSGSYDRAQTVTSRRGKRGRK